MSKKKKKPSAGQPASQAAPAEQTVSTPEDKGAQASKEEKAAKASASEKKTPASAPVAKDAEKGKKAAPKDASKPAPAKSEDAAGEVQPLFFPTKPFKTHGGVHVPHKKSTQFFESEQLPVPAKVVIPMQQHIGAPCTPCVKVGDSVKVGQLLGDSQAFVSAPIHSSVSGTVTAIGQVLLASGQRSTTVEIATDGLQEVHESVKPPKVESLEDLVKAVRASGLVGLGGAGFPAAVKLSFGDKPVDTLLINGAECEPYLTADFREMIEYCKEVMEGVDLLRKWLKVDRVIIGVESNKPSAIEILSRIAYDEVRDPENHVRVLKLKASYPQGAEKILIQACTGRRVPKGKLPLDVGCVVMNITSCAFIAKYLKTGMPLVSKRITVDGGAVLSPKNVVAPIGTPIADILAFCGGYKAEPRKLIMGGPMMGFALFDTAMPVLKQTNGLTVLTAAEVDESEPSDCIRCGRCVSVCPMCLQPTSIERATRTKDADELNRLSVMTCMECGSCAFICPAKRPLVQYMRLGKSVLRNAAPKK